MTRPSIFVSYSHKDKIWMNRLTQHLQVLEFEDAFSVWDDRKIQPGGDWLLEIEKALNQASIAVLLISVDFLNSNFIRTVEIPRLLQRRKDEGMRVFPIIIRSCPYTQVSWLSEIQVRPKDGKALASEDEYKIEEILTNIAVEIKTLLENTGTKLDRETLLEQEASLHVKSDDIYLPLFKISAGEEIFASGGATELSILARSNYEQDVSKTHEYIRINSIEFPYAQYADYILEVDVEGFAVASETSDADLKRGDWLFIRAEDNRTRLIGKTVAILMIEGNNLKASKKSFFQTYDHYFLRAQSEKDTSIAVVPYKLRNPTRIDDYYQEYPRLDRKFAYQIRVSGEVIGHMSNRNVKKILAEVIRQVPIMRLPEAGLGRPISERYILAYLYLTADEHQNADFGLKIMDDSMKDDNILAGDIALIHQQPTAKNGEIVAIVVFTPNREPLGVLKRYYIVHEKRKDLAHVLLESSNPSSEHLVVTPSGVNVEAVEDLYARQVKAGKIVTPQFFRDGEISIAGKYVGIVKDK